MTPYKMPFDYEQSENTTFPVIFPHAPDVFLKRSRRLAVLAEGHSLGEWLRFLSLLTGAQHEQLQAYSSAVLPEASALAFVLKQGQPPVPVLTWPRDPSWRQALTGIVCDLISQAPSPVQGALDRLMNLDAGSIEELANHVLKLDFRDHRDLLLFIGAALQVYWTALAAKIKQTNTAPPVLTGMCPCCGFLPVAGIVRSGMETDRLRYLHCGLCNTEWNLVRVTCSACFDSSGISYRYIEGSDRSVCTETCDSCKSYLKIVYQERSPHSDPVADDLSTLALDILTGEAGYNRIGPNLLFIPGTDDATQPDHLP